MRISSKDGSRSLKNKSFDSRSIISSDYIFLKNGKVKRKRGKNSYMETFLEKRRMAAEFAQSKECYSTISCKAKNNINLQNNRLYLKGIQEIININNLKNNLPGVAKSLIDNTDNIKNKRNTYSNEFFVQNINDINIINTTNTNDNKNTNIDISQPMSKSDFNIKNNINCKISNFEFDNDDQNEETSKFGNKIIDTNKSRKIGKISTKISENENELIFESNKGTNRDKDNNNINNNNGKTPTCYNKYKNINTYVRKRPIKDENGLIVTLRKNNETINNNQVNNSISFRNDLNNNYNEKNNNENNIEKNNINSISNNINYNNIKNNNININNNNTNKNIESNDFFIKYDKNQNDINRYIETNNEDNNNNINDFNNNIKDFKDDNNNNIISDNDKKEIKASNNIKKSDNDSNEISNDAIEEVNVIKSIEDNENEISFDNNNYNHKNNVKENCYKKINNNHYFKSENLKQSNKYMTNNRLELVQNKNNKNYENIESKEMYNSNANYQKNNNNNNFEKISLHKTHNYLEIPNIGISIQEKKDIKDIKENNIINENQIFKSCMSDKYKNNIYINYNDIDTHKNNNNINSIENNFLLYDSKNNKDNLKNNKKNNFSLVINKDIERLKNLKKESQKNNEKNNYFDEINNMINKLKEKRNNKINNLTSMNMENKDNKEKLMKLENQKKNLKMFNNEINKVFNYNKNKVSLDNNNDNNNNNNIENINFINNNNHYNNCKIMNYKNNIKNKTKSGNKFKINLSTRMQNLLNNINNINNEKNLNILEDKDNNCIFTQQVINSINNFTNQTLEEEKNKNEKSNNNNNNNFNINNINCNNHNNNFILLQNYYNNDYKNKKYKKTKNNYTTNHVNNIGSSDDMNSITDLNFISDDNVEDDFSKKDMKLFDDKIFKNIKTRHTRLSKSKPIIDLNKILFNNDNSKYNINSSNSRGFMKHTDYGSFAESNLYINKVREDLNNRNKKNDIERYISKSKRNSVYSNLYGISNKKSNENKNNNADINIMPANKIKGLFKPPSFF